MSESALANTENRRLLLSTRVSHFYWPHIPCKTGVVAAGHYNTRTGFFIPFSPGGLEPFEDLGSILFYQAFHHMMKERIHVLLIESPAADEQAIVNRSINRIDSSRNVNGGPELSSLYPRQENLPIEFSTRLNPSLAECEL